MWYPAAMKPRPATVILVALGLAACSACTHDVPAPKAVVPPPASPEAASAATSAWARVLSKRVDAQGRIDFAGLARDPVDLNAFVAWVAAVSPESRPSAFPTPEAKLAYFLNAYNALAMYNVVRSGTPLHLPSDQVRFFHGDKLLVGGRRLSLTDLGNELLRPLGDPRAHFAVNGMVRSSPRLCREPFAAERLDAQLDAAAREFLNDKKYVEPFPPHRVVRMSMILNWYKADFLAKAPSLAAYVDGFRPEPLPGGYEIEFMEFDWTLNAQ